MNAVHTPVKTEERTQLGIRPGDTVRVHQKVVEKGKTRLQVFEGLVLSVKHGTEAGATFTVRATMSGIGVEKIFPLYSPVIDKIEITRRSKVRRAKLYFIREKVAREVRRQLRNMRMVNLSTTDFKEEEKPEEVVAEEIVETVDAPVVEVETVPEGDVDVVTPEEVAAEEAREEKKNEEA
ncbi:MAG: 50S ribosomal protein L19 [Rectinemataceae bacterium]|nr:50S ribosomal protein L19 [Rectinemataceae bacterium]